MKELTKKIVKIIQEDKNKRQEKKQRQEIRNYIDLFHKLTRKEVSPSMIHRIISFEVYILDHNELKEINPDKLVAPAHSIDTRPHFWLVKLTYQPTSHQSETHDDVYSEFEFGWKNNIQSWRVSQINHRVCLKNFNGIQIFLPHDYCQKKTKEKEKKELEKLLMLIDKYQGTDLAIKMLKRIRDKTLPVLNKCVTSGEYSSDLEDVLKLIEADTAIYYYDGIDLLNEIDK